VRRLFIKGLLFLLVMVAGYVFWPRIPSLEAFRPPKMAALECEAFENAKARRTTSLALENFLESADNADRERALPYLQRTFEILRQQTGARFDPAVVARLQLHRWMLAADGNRQNQLPAAISEILAMIYGGSASEYSATAAAFAKADRLLASGMPEPARQAAVTAWRRLAEQLKARSQDKS
jgi:hypothetical protein